MKNNIIDFFPKEEVERTEEQESKIYELIGRIYSTSKSSEYTWETFSKTFQSFSFYSDVLSYEAAKEQAQQLLQMFEVFRIEVHDIKNSLEKFIED